MFLRLFEIEVSYGLEIFVMFNEQWKMQALLEAFC